MKSDSDNLDEVSFISFSKTLIFSSLCSTVALKRVEYIVFTFAYMYSIKLKLICKFKDSSEICSS